MATSFRDFTAVTRQDRDRFACVIDPRSWIVRGPNGGYLAALVLRALTERLGDEPGGDERAPRSLTLHYPAAPVEGPAEVRTRLLRAGRSLATMSAELVQDGSLMVTALAAFSTPWAAPAWDDMPAPVAPPVDAAFPVERALPLPYLEWWDQRLCLGLPLHGRGERAETGGWLALRDGAAFGAAEVAAATDAWPPAAFTRLEGPSAVPTVDLTIHFRRSLLPGADVSGPLLVRFSSRVAHEGFMDEDGEIWGPDGRLLAQSRQLAVLLGA